jgi:hypothetical protein
MNLRAHNPASSMTRHESSSWDGETNDDGKTFTNNDNPEVVSTKSDES